MYHRFDWCAFLFTLESDPIIEFLPYFCALDVQISTFSLIHVEFADGGSCYTQNLTSTAWVVYSPTNELLSSGRVYLGPATNNVAEYHAIIGLLTEAISLGVTQLIANLDSQLVVYQLNRIYSIRDPTLH